MPKRKAEESISNCSATGWSAEEQLQLLQASLKQCPDKDMVSFSTRASHLDWGSLQVGGHGIEDCKEQFQHLLSKVRKFRTLPEVVMDAKERIEHPTQLTTKKKKTLMHPDQPVKPLTAYFQFLADYRDKEKSNHPELTSKDLMKHLAQMWMELRPKKQNKYIKRYKKKWHLYLEASAKFREEHPELSNKQPQPPTPFLCYCDQKRPKLVAKHPEMEFSSILDKLKRRYARLSPEKKMKWISRAKEKLPLYQEQLNEYRLLHPGFVPPPAKVKLTKEEQLLTRETARIGGKYTLPGQPVKPPRTAFLLYMQKQMKKHPGTEFKMVSPVWKTLDESKKNKYAKKLAKLQERYARELEEFKQTLTEDQLIILEAQEALEKKKKAATPLKQKKEKKQKTVVNDGGVGVGVADVPPVV